MKAAADDIPLEVGEGLRVTFGSAGNDAAYCMSGWATAEPGYRWVLGEAGRLRLPVPAGSDPCMLVFRLWPLVNRERLPAQRVTVSVNGEVLAHFMVERETTRAVSIPRRLVGQDDVLDVVFATPDAARPADLGMNSDRRLLSVAFNTLDLYSEPGMLSAKQDVARNAGRNVARLSDAKLMFRFESLGENCEFGLVQRRFGAEPLGLLRFASVSLPKLLSALDAGFAGVGLRENTTVELSPNGLEYMIRDRAYGFIHHAWVEHREQEASTVLRRELRRVPFLKRKLLGDLQAAEKLFVFRGMRALAEEEVFPLAVALRRYGPNTLLFVCLANAAHPAGTVVWRAPGLLVGYLDRFAPGNNAHDALLNQWLEVCREACRVRVGETAVAGVSSEFC